MRFVYYLTILVSVYSFSAFPQVIIKKAPVKEKSFPKSYPIDGTPLLWQKDQETAKWVRDHPDYFDKIKLQKTSAWGFNIGSVHNWYAYNFVNGGYYLDASTCRGIGAHCYVFVENSQWNTKVNQAAVDAVVNEFENKTPANSNKGIYQTDVDAFGSPPDVDNDPRIIIQIMDILDGYNGSGGYTAGYFSSSNEIQGSGSNDAEIYYMDCNPTNLEDTASGGGLETALETCAHEFQHMINWNYHRTNPELTFVNEGCSMLAEINCGYPPSFPELYVNETNHYLLDWRGNDNTLVLNDYSRAQRYFIYWLDQFGIGIFKRVVQDKSVGLAGLESVLAAFGKNTSFTQLFINWLIANKLDDVNISSAYGYAIHTGLPKAVSKNIYYNPNVTATDTVADLGAEYLTYTSGSNLNITFSAPASNNLVIKAIEEGSSQNRVLDVPINSAFSEPEYGSTYTSIHFVIIDTSIISRQIYSYTSTGSVSTAENELKWDVTEPTGYAGNLTSSDTACVTFNAVPGGRLDSIRIALRRAGSITGGIWTYTGGPSTRFPSPLGKPLAVPITAAINSSTSVINPNGTYPYPIPFDNWTSVDLRSYNIPTDNAFAVGFAIGSDPTTPGVMVTDYPGQGFYHNYTYLHTADGVSTPGWNYVLISSDTTISMYLIHAYVSLITGVEKEIDLTPKTFSLSQNYPNPFNPSTVINFAVPKAGMVRIAVFNDLGQQVAILADKEYSAGNYSINFNAASLSSGVYYYRIEAGSFIQTKKMVLLK